MIRTDLWPRLRPLVLRAQRPVRYLDHEFGAVHHAPGELQGATTFAMMYPDTYELGQANQAVRILVNAVNSRADMAAERAYLPDAAFCDEMRRAGLPLFSLESCAPLREFDVVGITLPHELAATNVLEALDLAGIPIRAEARGEGDPVVIGGGPCALNPEPYHLFFDAILVGEGEESVPEVVGCVGRARREGAPRHELLRRLAAIEGVYVPQLYAPLAPDEARAAQAAVAPVEDGVPAVVRKRVFRGFAESPAFEPCVVPFADLVHDRLNVEVLRGCARGCRFCQAGMMYRPVRERSAEGIVEGVLAGLACTGYEEVSLTSLSTTDHSQIASVLGRLNRELEGRGVRVSIPSQRLDSFGVDMARLVAGEARGGLTFAPEAGTQRLRDAINKNVTEDDLFGAIAAAFDQGWRRCKLYFMLGLPTETDEDAEAIADLLERAYQVAKQHTPPDERGRIRMGASCALFVPKAATPFQWCGQVPPEEALRRVNLVRAGVRSKALTVTWHDPATSFVEAVMSRGGRECAYLVERAWQLGARFDAWTEHFRADAWRQAADELGVDLDAVAQRERDVDDVLPWQHISMGVSLRYLRAEHARALRAETTPDCTFEACTGCGLCPDLGMENMLQEARRG